MAARTLLRSLSSLPSFTPPRGLLFRAASTEAPATAATAAPGSVIGSQSVRRPVGGFRGGLMGFLLGFGIASAYGYYYLLEEYHSASSLLLTSVEELQASTQKMASHVRRIEVVEKDLKALSDVASTKSDRDDLRKELKSVYEGLHEDVLALRSRLWGVEKDVHAALKDQNTTVRI